VPNYIHPATPELAYKVAEQLTDADYREVYEGHGKDPKIWIPIWSLNSDSYYFTDKKGNLAGMAGVEDGGAIWMLCTEVIYRNKIMFVREAKKFIDSRKEKYLYNIVDKRNTVHLDLLRWLGFKFIREITYGPNNLSFIEFIRPCAHPLQSESPQQLPES